MLNMPTVPPHHAQCAYGVPTVPELGPVWDHCGQPTGRHEAGSECREYVGSTVWGLGGALVRQPTPCPKSAHSAVALGAHSGYYGQPTLSWPARAHT